MEGYTWHQVVCTEASWSAQHIMGNPSIKDFKIYCVATTIKIFLSPIERAKNIFSASWHCIIPEPLRGSYNGKFGG